MERIELTREMETLLIPLYGKAMDYYKDKSILGDEKAASIIDQIDYDFSNLKIAEKTNVMMCLRAKLIDDYVKGYLQYKEGVVVLHLGCGLDSRSERIGSTNTMWYDLDFEEVISIRRKFYGETDKYCLMPSSVTESEWLDEIPKDRQHYIVVAEGLSMYLTENDIRQLCSRLMDRCGGFTLIMDAYSELTARSAKNHPSLKRTGAVIRWGIDDPTKVEKWGEDIRFVEEQYFTMSEYNQSLSLGNRVMFGIANMFAAAQRAHRLLIYDFGKASDM